MYVYGESIKSSLIALVVLDGEYLSKTCPDPFSYSDELHKSADFNDFVLDSMLKLGKDELNSLEQVNSNNFILKIRFILPYV